MNNISTFIGGKWEPCLTPIIIEGSIHHWITRPTKEERIFKAFMADIKEKLYLDYLLQNWYITMRDFLSEEDWDALESFGTVDDLFIEFYNELGSSLYAR